MELLHLIRIIMSVQIMIWKMMMMMMMMMITYML